MLRRSFLLTLCGLILLIILPALAPAHGDKPDVTARPTPLPFEPTEELVYEGEFSKSVFRGIEIAEFHFTAAHAPVDQTTTNNQPTANTAEAANATNLVFKGDATAKGWFRKLFHIDFHFQMESLVEPKTFSILRTTKRDEQGKRLRMSEAVFDRSLNLITWTERNPNAPANQPIVVKNPLNNAAHDFLSAIYYLRTRQLAPGASLELVLSDSGQVFHIPVKVIERKRMKTVLGKVQTLRLEIELFGADRLIQDRTGRMSLWLTDDARRIPVRALLDTDDGDLDIKLKKAVTGNR
jgi:hypothetical protein